MFKRKMYNVATPCDNKGKYNEERAEVQNLPRKKGVRNVGFEYATKKEAMLARAAVSAYIRKTQLHVTSHQRGNMVIVKKFSGNT